MKRTFYPLIILFKSTANYLYAITKSIPIILFIPIADIIHKILITQRSVVQVHSPQSKIYKDNNYEISGWFELVAKVCEILYSIDSDKLKEIVVQNKIHKSTSKHNIGIKDPILSYKKEFLISSLQIKDTGIYVETSLSSNRARCYTKQILDLFELTDEFQLYVY